MKEKVEITRHREITKMSYHEIMGELQEKLTVETTVVATQKVIMIKQTRFKVTTCLYLSPNNSAGSLYLR